MTKCTGAILPGRLKIIPVCWKTECSGNIKEFPDYPTLDIPDIKTFCLEVGDAIGLSKNQSEAFAIAADEDLRRAKIDFNRPPPIPSRQS